MKQKPKDFFLWFALVCLGALFVALVWAESARGSSVAVDTTNECYQKMSTEVVAQHLMRPEVLSVEVERVVEQSYTLVNGFLKIRTTPISDVRFCITYKKETPDE